MEDHVRAVPPGGLLLRDRRTLGHEDGRLDAEQLRGERDALRVVAGRRRHHAVRALLRRQPRDPHVGAAGLERPGALEVLALQRDRPAGERGEPARLLHRGLDGDPAQHLARRLDVGQSPTVGTSSSCSVSSSRDVRRPPRSPSIVPRRPRRELLGRIVTRIGAAGQVLHHRVHRGGQRTATRAPAMPATRRRSRSRRSRRAGAARPTDPSGTAAGRGPRSAGRGSRRPSMNSAVIGPWSTRATRIATVPATVAPTIGTNAPRNTSTPIASTNGTPRIAAPIMIPIASTAATITVARTNWVSEIQATRPELSTWRRARARREPDHPGPDPVAVGEEEVGREQHDEEAREDVAERRADLGDVAEVDVSGRCSSGRPGRAGCSR